MSRRQVITLSVDAQLAALNAKEVCHGKVKLAAKWLSESVPKTNVGKIAMIGEMYSSYGENWHNELLKGELSR